MERAGGPLIVVPMDGATAKGAVRGGSGGTGAWRLSPFYQPPSQEIP